MSVYNSATTGPKTALIAFASFAITLSAVLLWPKITPLFRGNSCDSDAVVATVKELAMERLNKVGGTQYLIRKGGSSSDHRRITEMAIRGTIAEHPMTIGAIRDRGAIGNGIRCAGIVYMSSKSDDGPEFAAEYTIEPTSDGKTIITAKFAPD